MIKFNSLNTAAKDLQLIQDNVGKAITQLQSSTPFQDGNYLTGVAVPTGSPVVVNHNLGRQPQIWSVGDLNTNAVVWRSAWTSTTITLNSSANCTISLWVS